MQVKVVLYIRIPKHRRHPPWHLLSLPNSLNHGKTHHNKISRKIILLNKKSLKPANQGKKTLLPPMMTTPSKKMMAL